MVCTINNCPITIEDVRNANTIYDCNVPTLKLKIVRQQSKRVQAEYTEVPGILRERIGNLTVAADVMFANRIPFIVSVLIGDNFTMVEYVSQSLKNVLTNSIGKAFKFYKNIIYNIKNFLMDREFECIRDSLSEEVNLNNTAVHRHK